MCSFPLIFPFAVTREKILRSFGFSSCFGEDAVSRMSVEFKESFY